MLLSRASLYVQGDDYPRAIDDYTAYLRQNPESETAYRLRGQAFEAIGSLVQAIDDFGACLRLDPDSIEIRLRRAALYQQRDQFDEATREFRMVLQLNPAHAQATLGLVRSERLTEWRQQSIDELSKAIAAAPNDAAAYRRRGIVHRDRGYLFAANGDLTVALILDPTSARTWYQRAETNEAAGHFPECLADVEQALSRAPGDAWAIGLKGWILVRTSDVDVRDVPQGLALLRRARDLSAGKSPQILERLAQAEEAAGNFDRAIATQEELLRLIEEFDVEEPVIAEYRAALARYQLKRVALLTLFFR